MSNQTDYLHSYQVEGSRTTFFIVAEDDEDAMYIAAQECAFEGQELVNVIPHNIDDPEDGLDGDALLWL